MRQRLATILAILLLTPISAAARTQEATSFREASAKTPKSQKILLSAQVSDTYLAARLQTLNVKLRPGTEHRADSNPTTQTSRHCKAIVYKTLTNLPFSHRAQLSQLTLFYTKDGRRGLGGSGAVVLRCLNVSDEELSSVLVHEIGHLVDSGMLFGAGEIESGFYDFDTPVKNDDPSVNFYRINWINENKRKTDSSQLNFVSLYAMTDPFEDFAETYTYYRLHGPEFRALAAADGRLRQKYNFMKEFVFDGQEYGGANLVAQVSVTQRNYDVTVLPLLY